MVRTHTRHKVVPTTCKYGLPITSTRGTSHCVRTFPLECVVLEGAHATATPFSSCKLPPCAHIFHHSAQHADCPPRHAPSPCLAHSPNRRVPLTSRAQVFPSVRAHSARTFFPFARPILPPLCALSSSYASPVTPDMECAHSSKCAALKRATFECARMTHPSFIPHAYTRLPLISFNKSRAHRSLKHISEHLTGTTRAPRVRTHMTRTISAMRTALGAHRLLFAPAHPHMACTMRA